MMVLPAWYGLAMHMQRQKRVHDPAHATGTLINVSHLRGLG
jgi:hypothetical protein